MEMLLTVEQTAQRLQLTPKTVRERLKTGRLRGIKSGGRVWRVPESALLEPAPASGAKVTQAEAERLWTLLSDISTHNRAIVEIARAPLQVRAILDERSAQIAEDYYATPEGEAELADWRALDGEPFHEPHAGDKE